MKVNIYGNNNELLETISLYEFNKRKDITKHYTKIIKSKKDFVKYINDNVDKLFEILSNNVVGYNCTGGKCNCLTIKLLETNCVGNKHTITIYYNEIEDLALIDEYYKDYETEYKQEIYTIMY